MYGGWKRAVVTGGAGFIGSHVCERLLAGGSEVHCVDNLVTGSRANIAHLSGNRRFCFVETDVTDPGSIEAAPDRVDLVLDLACPASPVDYLRLPIETLEAGSNGTRTALELARRDRARFLLASTSEVYGDPLEHPQSEGYWGNVNPVGPRSVYDESKRYAEALVSAYRRTYGTDTSIVRIFNTYGPRMRSDDGRAVPTFIRQALAGDPLTVAGDGSQTRSLTYVDDTVDGILSLAASGRPGPVNIGGSDETTVLELAERIIGLTGSASTIAFVERPEDDPGKRRPDTATAHRLLGWQPRVDCAEGLKRTVEWFARSLTP
ncbi:MULTISPECIES: UDP-glucuronic acid decarboxylase family protein [Streptomyces]|uniref:SDR family oxidoreductase n=1 Tax=Streptomyces morookaense TaxID=1970 RepID=A0A7Y7E5T1_STRMO|nr:MULTISPECIES: UDP-glucuronic acid decarboxylase family protein [Streptomyces]MCC2274453.1 SDR family oxidoreductase [Streptomyces sp. ET3-23]NVK76472.1 SDR family oxidoreductase [Streptomyces morookaense]GHF07346.1 epimerase [Streptomyces morookaense]